MADAHPRLNPGKVALAQEAFAKHGVMSFADLGACWGVHGGYTFAALDALPGRSAYIVDQHVTPTTRELAAGRTDVRLVEGLLGWPAVLNRIPSVDGLLLYDILLHQVLPDWDGFLDRWAEKARVVVIFNQMWKVRGPSIRFIDRGEEWYLHWVHHTGEERIRQWFKHHQAVVPGLNRRRRDLNAFWQFGITTRDLILRMQALGFRLDAFENHGPFSGDLRPWIQNESFVFVRADRPGAFDPADERLEAAFGSEPEEAWLGAGRA